MRTLCICLGILALALLGGCATPGPDKVRIGMSEAEVVAAVGEPECYGEDASFRYMHYSENKFTVRLVGGKVVSCRDQGQFLPQALGPDPRSSPGKVSGVNHAHSASAAQFATITLRSFEPTTAAPGQPTVFTVKAEYLLSGTRDAWIVLMFNTRSPKSFTEEASTAISPGAGEVELKVTATPKTWGTAPPFRAFVVIRDDKNKILASRQQVIGPVVSSSAINPLTGKNN